MGPKNHAQDTQITDQDAYCNAVAKNAVASCMIVEDEDESEKCMEEVIIIKVVNLIFDFNYVLSRLSKRLMRRTLVLPLMDVNATILRRSMLRSSKVLNKVVLVTECLRTVLDGCHTVRSGMRMPCVITEVDSTGVDGGQIYPSNNVTSYPVEVKSRFLLGLSVLKHSLCLVPLIDLVPGVSGLVFPVTE